MPFTKQTRMHPVWTKVLKLCNPGFLKGTTGSGAGNVRVPARSSGLKKASVVNVSQVITVDKSFLAERVGKLNTQQLSAVEDGLRLILGV